MPVFYPIPIFMTDEKLSTGASVALGVILIVLIISLVIITIKYWE